MKGNKNLSKRLEALEQRQEPFEVEVYWSEDEIPPEKSDSVIRLRWGDEL